MNGPHWTIPVLTGATRKPSTLTVSLSDDNQIVFLPPPGEGFILPAGSVGLLHEATREAHDAQYRAAQRGLQ